MPARQTTAAVLALLLMAGPAAAQDPAEAFADCTLELDGEALDARYAALAAEHDIEDRVDALCAAGDRDGAAALWSSFEEELYAGREGAAARACMEAALAFTREYLATLGVEIDDAQSHVCDEEF